MAKKFKEASYKEKLEMIANQDAAINLHISAPKREMCSIIAMGMMAIVETLEGNVSTKKPKKTSSEEK